MRDSSVSTGNFGPLQRDNYILNDAILLVVEYIGSP